MTSLITTYGPRSPATFAYLGEAAVLEICRENHLAVAESRKSDLFLTASQLEKGEITTAEFCDLAKAWCAIVTAPAIGSLHHASQIVSASLDITQATAAVAAAIKERALTANMCARYLDGLELADGLAPESIRIVSVVQEITEKSLID